MTNCEYKYRQKIPSVNLNILVVTLTSKGILVTLLCFARYTPVHFNVYLWATNYNNLYLDDYPPFRRKLGKTPPGTIGWDVSHLAFGDIIQVQIMLECIYGNRLCQHVCCILRSVSFLKQQFTRKNWFFNPVRHHIYKLGSYMIHLVLCQEMTLWLSQYNWTLPYRIPIFFTKLVRHKAFFGNLSHYYIFWLSSR